MSSGEGVDRLRFVDNEARLSREACPSGVRESSRVCRSSVLGSFSREVWMAVRAFSRDRARSSCSSSAVSLNDARDSRALSVEGFRSKDGIGWLANLIESQLSIYDQSLAAASCWRATVGENIVAGER